MKDYGYLIGYKYIDDLEIGLYIRDFLNMCSERKQLVREYKSLYGIKTKYKRHHNTDYNKAMGYLYMFTRNQYITQKKVNSISNYMYCLAMIDENYLNQKLYIISEEIAFLNVNIKKLKPFFREYKKKNNIRKIDINKTLKFDGLIDANTSIELNLSKDEIQGVKKFLSALNNGMCSYMNCTLLDKNTMEKTKY